MAVDHKKKTDFNVENFLDIESFVDNTIISGPHGLLRPNKFVCLLNVPAAMKKYTKGSWLEWHVLSAQVPAISLDTGSMEINSWPHYYLKGRTDSEFEITFLESADLTLRSFFYTWINSGFDMVSGRRDYIENVQATEVKLVPLNWKGDGIRCDIFSHVFPIDISGLEFDVGVNDSMLKTTVKFKYIFHTIDYVNKNDTDRAKILEKHQSTKKNLNNSVVPNTPVDLGTI